MHILIYQHEVVLRYFPNHAQVLMELHDREVDILDGEHSVRANTGVK